MRRYITHADIEHVNRIYSEVRWYVSAKAYNPPYDYVIPKDLLLAYAKNMLGYYKCFKIDYSHKKIDKTVWKVRETLKMIEETVMLPEFPDIELRMAIIRMYHDAGYQLAGQTRLEL